MGCDSWDILLSLDAEPKRAEGGGFYCQACETDARQVFADRPALWADHLFESLLGWVNDSLARAKWLALYGHRDRATWARLLPAEDASETLRGGGIQINFAALSERRPLRREGDTPCIRLPCCV